MVLTDVMESKQNAFQLKGFRQIMQIKTTYIDRSNTSEYVYRSVETEFNKNKNKIKTKVSSVAEAVNSAAMKLLGDIIRRPNTDPLRRVTLHETSAEPLLPAIRRVGRPRGHWAMKTMEKPWEANALWTQSDGSMEESIKFDAEDREHHKIIYEAAIAQIC